MSPSTGEEDNTSGNPLLKDFQFPPYDAIRADHICPGIRTLLTQLVRNENCRFTCEIWHQMIVVGLFFPSFCVINNLINARISGARI